MEQPLKLPTGTYQGHLEVLGILLDGPGARIKKEPEMVDQHDKIRANNEEWRKVMLVLTEKG